MSSGKGCGNSLQAKGAERNRVYRLEWRDTAYLEGNPLLPLSSIKTRSIGLRLKQINSALIEKN